MCCPAAAAVLTPPGPHPRCSRQVRALSSSSDSIPSAYTTPKVYDIAFSFRDFESEAAFLLEAHSAFSSTGSTRPSFLEVGCGPARHAMLLAGTRIMERCVGIDVSQAMVDYAMSVAKEQNVDSHTDFFVADMMDSRGFKDKITGSDGLFDVAAVMLGTFSHCLDNRSAARTLSNIAECVKPGGILVIELGHPRDIYQGTFCTDGFVNVWEIGESGDVDFADELPEDDLQAGAEGTTDSDIEIDK
jgi:SAM-dependent methyltransferase